MRDKRQRQRRRQREKQAPCRKPDVRLDPRTWDYDQVVMSKRQIDAQPLSHPDISRVDILKKENRN